MSKAFFLRGMCYNQMGDFQRALYDMSMAIRIEKDKKENERDGSYASQLAEYYSKQNKQIKMIS